MVKEPKIRCVLHRPAIRVGGFFLILFLGAIAGCSGRGSSGGSAYEPPARFQEKGLEWVRQESELTKKDDQLIQRFFGSNRELLGSPEWHGQPKKYVSQDSKHHTRYYWFVGNSESPTWNFIEYDGQRFRTSAGQGKIGTTDGERK